MDEATDLASWFSDDELERCPSCGALKLVPSPQPQPLRVCLDCGIVDNAKSAAAA